MRVMRIEAMRLVLAAWVAAAAVSMLIAAPATVHACPGCKEAAFDTAEQAKQKQASARGYATSIGLMLLMPVALVGGIVWFVVRGVKAPTSPSSAASLPDQGGRF